MNVHHAILASAFSLAATASIGAETPPQTQPLTRAQVKQTTLDAIAAGQLHAGEDVHYPATAPTPPRKNAPWKKKQRAAEAKTAPRIEARQ